MVKSPLLLLIGTSLLLLAGIRSAQAEGIRIASPSSYRDREGPSCFCGDSASPYRYQQVFPAADFAALGNQPHWIVGFAPRADQSATSAHTADLADNEIRLSTTGRAPNTPSLQFDDNHGSDVMQFYSGPLTMVADAQGPGPGPKGFYNPDFPAGVSPFLYDPSRGNLLLDFIAWQGESPKILVDQVPGVSIGGGSSATQGARQPAAVFQFTFIPVTPGDYNRDRTVDAADYVVWRKGLGTTYTPADYDVWRANFGQTIGGGAAGYPLGASAEPLSIAVPEPAAWVILLTGMLAIFSRRSNSPPSPARACVGLANVSTIKD